MKTQNSARLSYRLMTATDADLLFELDQDPEVMRYVNDSKCTTWDEIKEVYIPRMEKYTNPEKGWGLWMVSLLENNIFIGWILVRPKDFFREQPVWDNLELGWRFKREFWGKGYAIEAAEAIKQALIEQSSIHKISAIALEENIASIKIMQKLGMKYIKTYLHQDPLFSEEVVLYELETA